MGILRNHLLGSILATEEDSAGIDRHGCVVSRVGSFVNGQHVADFGGDAGVVDHAVIHESVQLPVGARRVFIGPIHMSSLPYLSTVLVIRLCTL